jgi:catechol 2,3-dioxygenase-like lactoylglutathione lyase family enzyme
MAGHFDHIHITSRDSRRSARWWAGMFGAEVLPEAEIRGVFFAPVSLDGVKISISGPRPEAAGGPVEPGEPAAVPHYGLEHLGIKVDDVEAALARFRAQGLEVYERAELALFKVAFVAAPDGVCLKLMEAKG